MKTSLFSVWLAPLFGSAQLLLANPAPIVPTTPDGQPLNFDFEDGSLKHWFPEGNAFEKQPVRGDLVAPRQGPGGTSRHQGEFWIGGWEIHHDDAMGTLASIPFKVTQPWASFLLAGGNWPETRVELIDQSTQKVFFKASGEESERLRPVVVELKGFVGKEIFIRLVDQRQGHWGHLNFDDFKFYAERPKFDDEIDASKQTAGVPPAADSVLYEGLSPEDAAAKMTVPPGFKATLFAGEPDVMQPIAFCLDDRGRLFVAEAYTYPIRTGTAPLGKNEKPTSDQLKDIFGGKDRIICLEDTDGDGKFNKRTVVAEKLNLVSGIEQGFGGLFVGAPPYLLFLPIANWDEPKAGEPKILLDGWAYQDTHETLNTFKWGPDGWLYGCHGVFTHSHVGRPGAAESDRTRINAGVWRYHPTKHVFEVFAEGTSNPWGIDFDEHGQLFAEACVIPHLFHLVQGGRFTRQAGSHFNPFVYDDIKNCADHVHYAGNKGPHAGNNRSDATGGGHAHAGLLIYQGDNWPAEYRGQIFIGNIHGQRINMDIPERKGSGFIGKHGADIINFNDKWSQVIDFRTGPDGGVYFIDWYDKNQCHHNNVDGHDRSNGRIYKVTYGTPKFARVDLQKKTDEELVGFLANKNDWQARHAQRVLQERSTHGMRLSGGKRLVSDEQTANWIASESAALLNTAKDKAVRLRALWALHVVDDAFTPLEPFLKDADEYCRAWAIQGICEQISEQEMDNWPKVLDQLKRLAREDKSPVVRLYLASALQRLPVEQRWEILEGLYGRGEDADDHNLPMMYWYAGEAAIAADTNKALQLLEKTKIPVLRQFIARRLTAKLDAAGVPPRS